MKTGEGANAASKLHISATSNRNLPVVWLVRRLNELCTIDVGFAFKSNEFSATGIRLLRGENIEPGSLRWLDTRYWPENRLDEFRHLIVDEGDIILAMDRPVISSGLKIARARATDVPCLLVQRVARLKSSDHRLLHYIFYSLCTQSFVNHLLKGQTGTQLPHVSHKSIQAYQVPLAPSSEQLRIVAKIEELFSDLDAGVAALERVRANLKRYRAAVLKAAVEGKLTEDWRAQHPDTEPASVLLERMLTERRNKWEKDQLARFAQAGKQPPKGWQEKYEVPARLDSPTLPKLEPGWSWATLDEIGQEGRPILYGIIKPGPHIENGIPYVRVTEMKNGRIDVLSLRRTSPARAAKFAKATLCLGDLLISKDGTIGRVAVVPPELVGGNIIQHVMRAPIHGKLIRD